MKLDKFLDTNNSSKFKDKILNMGLPAMHDYHE